MAENRYVCSVIRKWKGVHYRLNLRYIGTGDCGVGVVAARSLPFCF